MFVFGENRNLKQMTPFSLEVNMTNTEEHSSFNFLVSFFQLNDLGCESFYTFFFKHNQNQHSSRIDKTLVSDNLVNQFSLTKKAPTCIKKFQPTPTKLSNSSPSPKSKTNKKNYNFQKNLSQLTKS
jgi:hypothetical protein